MNSRPKGPPTSSSSSSNDLPSVVSVGRVFSPSEVARYVEELCPLLTPPALKRDALVAIRLPRVLEALFMKACIDSRVTSCPISSAVATGFLNPDLVVSTLDEDSKFGQSFLRIEPGFLSKRSLGNVPLSATANDPGDFLVRLIFSSGTTGSPKAIAFKKSMLEARYRSGSEIWMAKTPQMSLLGIGTVAGFQTFYANMRMGQTYFVPGSANENFDLIKKHEIRLITASPNQISELIDVALERGENLPSLETIQSAGSFIPNHLAQLAEKLLGGKVKNLYGSTEAGLIATRDFIPEDPFFAGTLLDDVEVEIVSEHDEVLQTDEMGIVRCRKPGMATEYYMNPEATKLAFKDGWFYPGDKGRLDSERGLYLAGRVSEGINSGGVKIDPIRIDDFAVQSKGVADAAAFTFEDERSVQRIALAVVVKEGFDVISFISKLKSTFGEAHPQVIFHVNEIPRNEAGKVLRSRITEIYQSVGKN